MSAWFSFIAYLCTHKLFWTKDFLDNHSLYIVCVLNNIEGVRIPCLCILYSNANILNYAQTLGSFLISFRALYLSYHDIFFCSIGSLIACFICWSSPHHVIFMQSLILNIVWFPSSIHHWICALDSTQIMRSAHFGEELTLYWPSKFFTHFDNRCQWGRSLEGLREWFYT